MLAGWGLFFLPDVLSSPPISSLRYAVYFERGYFIDNVLYSLSFSFDCVSRLHSVNGTDGTIAASGTTAADYLYWNATTSEWTVGSGAVNLGARAVASGQNAVAIGQDGKYSM